ncbi:uncharacterized protein LAESUDRAFT_751869 [Laetiporus sulphureus 93-53]|uniref:Uncharacterized protein n=1 Tax=Laetiporus sulphureus 93-53 TaxID=1314785 RepID=A0A165CIK0_9APHY|nr:uncharacterized protein LAESUDRAFT_751869 [Laetiporus sulphureus 93-53]KZT02877.1 hypothetical protein LAESUDRAFT_751869 [Laetiporus sulphureus 93-53]
MHLSPSASSVNISSMANANSVVNARMSTPATVEEADSAVYRRLFLLLLPLFNSQLQTHAGAWNASGPSMGPVTPLRSPHSHILLVHCLRNVESISRDLYFKADRLSSPLSCYGPAKQQPNVISGLDESPEELCVKAFLATKAGTFFTGLSEGAGQMKYEADKIAAAEQTFANARMNVKQVYEQATRNIPSRSAVDPALARQHLALTAFWKPAQATSAFGSGSALGQPAQSASAFGQPAQSTSAFGQPAQSISAFGQPARSASAFDHPQTTSAFGQPFQTTTAFGQPAQTTSASGQPAQPSSIPFGQASTTTTFAFGLTAFAQSSLIKPATREMRTSPLD